MHMCSSIGLYLATSYIDIHHPSGIYISYNIYTYMYDRQIDGLDKVDRVDKIDKVDKVDRVGR